MTGSLAFRIVLKMLQLPAGVSVDTAIAAYRQNPAVALLAPNAPIKATSLSTSPTALGMLGGWIPDDPLFPDQWALQDGVTNVLSLWRRDLSAKNVLIAVVDTGIDYTHPDLAGRVEPGYNFVDGNTDVMDRDGHGTHVAGIIAAAGNNGIGVAGIAWDAKLLAVKVMNRTGGSNFAAISGIKYAVDHGAKVINLSFTKPTPGRNPLFDLAVQYATAHGVLVVAAAGNEHGAVCAPANCPGALAIAALGDQTVDTLAPYSNFGPQIFMAAPGTDILSTYPGDQYRSLSGTSMAAPMVSAAAALLMDEHPDWNLSEIEHGLEEAADPVGTATRSDQYGYGCLDFAKLP